MNGRRGQAAGRSRRFHSLRAKLTLVNVALLALGIAAATAVSLIGMRHYLLENIDAELTSSRTSLQRTGLTLRQIESLSELGIALDKLSPGPNSADEGASSLPRNETVFVAVDRAGEPITVGTLRPTARQRDLASAVDDPKALATADEPHDVTVHGDPYRAVGARLADGTTVLLATSTANVQTGIHKALRLDFTLGTGLLALLAVLTMIGVSHRMRPLEDMVETASAIADGDLARRVPPHHDTALEVEQLRLALNSMLHQVETAFETRERSSAQLRRFVADASHELRTPLAAIRGYLQLYDKGMLRDPAERTRALGRVHAEADRMSRLVDELLTLARLDQGPELRLRNVDLSRLVREAADDLRVQQPDRPVQVAADGALLVRADESGLRQILGNLLANVRTHTPKDAPVSVSLERVDGTVRLCVADEGPGLDEEDAARIFDRFFRAGGGAGSGLGLAIVQGVVSAHGGEVSVRTAPGAGVRVTVVLPGGGGPVGSAAAEVVTPSGESPSSEKPSGDSPSGESPSVCVP
ncbi:ATP-binding protein [Streptomyces sp. NPDC056002]|uniref:sensor histidine kinase n=1 Tax=unclassified Streptomyces TaxID=2593676 RepID=UPI0035DD5E0C